MQNAQENETNIEFKREDTEVNILLVDDRVENLVDLEAILGDLGCNLIRASSGKDALRLLLLQKEFAVILLDVSMPVMDGFETARHIRGRPKTVYTPIIFVTAYDEDIKHSLKAYALGAVDYITKPISSEALRAKINIFVDLFRKTAELKFLNKQLQNRAEEKLWQKNNELEREIQERKQVEKRLEYLAHHDALTGLPNRVLLLDRLTHAIAQAHRNKSLLGVLFIDLDRFKTINDSLGHYVGDRLLKVIAQRLTEQLREEDTVARIGGDEFVVVLSHLGEVEHAKKVAENLIFAISAPCKLDNHQINPTPSIGISIYPKHGDDASTLIRNADNAMYQAKRSGRNRSLLFTDEMTVAENERLAIETGLYKALENEEFELCYQPEYQLETGNLQTVEALIRWRHPRLGLLRPERFIHIAEETGLIISIGEWVLKKACQEFKAWRQKGMEIPRFSINLSVAQFRQVEMISMVKETLQAQGVEPDSLIIEITESVLMQSAESSVAILASLKGLGVNIAIDDFGKGYSSLGYLKSFPIRQLKIDRSFVQSMVFSQNDKGVVSAIIGLAKNLGWGVVAEGVENRNQLETLRDMGCLQVQGHLFGAEIKAGAQLHRLVW